MHDRSGQVLAANLQTAKEIFNNASEAGLVTGRFDVNRP